MRKPPNYWMNQDNIVREIRRVMRTHRFQSLPSSRQLLRTRNTSLSNAIRRNGGFRRFRELLGQEQIRVEKDSWKSLEFTIEQAQQIMRENNWDTLPGRTAVENYSRLTNAIYNYHGGMRRFREILGQKPLEKEKGYWQNLDNVKKELEDVMREHNLESLPTQYQLTKLGKSILAYAIHKYHGGFRKFRELYGEEPKRRSVEDLKDPDYCISEAKRIMQEHGLDSLPIHRTLVKLGCGYLSKAITHYHRGFYNFRKLLGETSPRPKMGSWQSLEYTISRAEEVMKENEWSTLPRSDILRRNGYSSLALAITKYHGGFPTFRETLRQHTTGKSTKEELEDLLESYAGDD